MNYVTSGIGFIKVGKEDNTYRYIDVIPLLNNKNSVIEPYVYAYDFLQKNRTLNYCIPVEGMNSESSLDIIKESNINYSKNEMLYISNYFLPQVNINSDVIESNEIASTTKSDGVDGDNSFSIYLITKPDETWIEVYDTSNEQSDPYGESNSSNVTSLMGRQYLSNPSFMKKVVIGVTVDPSTWNYSMSLVNQISNPVKWLVDDKNKDYTRINSKNNLVKSSNESVTLVSGRLKIHDRLINSVGIDLEEIPIINMMTDYIDSF